MKLSACWIVKNEEKNLPRSIRSVSRVVDEIIVVDTGSTDGTIAVAESLRAKVFHFEWINDFSAARNYAIQQATGDVIVFLDADEWFVPALSRRNRRVIEETFSYPEIDCITIKRTDVQEETGEVSSMDFTNLRIFRKDPSLLYMNSIHEFLRKKTAEGFGTPNTLPRPEWNINHSGYSANVFAEKASRNIEMLEAALEETNDTSTLFLYHSYLLREYNSAGQIEKAFTQLQYLMGRPEEIAAAARLFDKGFIGRIFIAMSVGYAFRDKIDKEQLYADIAVPAKLAYSDFENSMIDLYYQFVFCLSPKRFYETFSSVRSQFVESGVEGLSEIERAILLVIRFGVEIAFHLGEYDKAFELVNRLTQSTRNYDYYVFSMLIDCLHGQPDDTVIPYLLSVLDFERPETYPLLLEVIKRTQRKTVFLYLQKKRLDDGSLSQVEFLFLTLVSGNAQQVGSLALSIDVLSYMPVLVSEIDKQLFLATIVNNQWSFYETHRDRLGRFERLLDAYFSGLPLEDHTLDERLILAESYHLLAFAGGVDVADRFIHIYSANPLVCYVVRAKYYYENRMDLKLVQMNRDGVPLTSKDSYRFLCGSLIRCGRYEECLAILEELLDNGHYEEPWFIFLYAISVKGGDDLAAWAMELYEKYLPMYENRESTPGERGPDVYADNPDKENYQDPLASVVMLDDYRS